MRSIVMGTGNVYRPLFAGAVCVLCALPATVSMNAFFRNCYFNDAIGIIVLRAQ